MLVVRRRLENHGSDNMIRLSSDSILKENTLAVGKNFPYIFPFYLPHERNCDSMVIWRTPMSQRCPLADLEVSLHGIPYVLEVSKPGCKLIRDALRSKMAEEQIHLIATKLARTSCLSRSAVPFGNSMAKLFHITEFTSADKSI
ncbi:hypothetical protein TNCV_3877071 [Trichonephila clavipes]|uniref:Uncharacterized protein n=1 Tax=Trichonephila clavipes TaxID=2585209 RepID=A0A8X6SS60_TRICX|nr:hypothetical protein TNCV_3877071 [Trichonephila clavipes]